ncbi:MAG: lipid-A-disaccharide synthase [Caulobacteraceae bacterium]
MNPPNVFISALEPSADELGAGLVRALRARAPGGRFIGVGGRAMEDEGVKSLFPISDLAIFGALEGILAYPRVRARVAQAAAYVAEQRPDAVVLIDSWGFSQRLAARLRRLPRRPMIIKYVAPQVWATRAGRARLLAGRVDHLLAINSFDPPLFEHWGLAATFVGSPAASTDFSDADPLALRVRLGIGPTDPILLLMPGSRQQEVRRLLHIFEETARRLRRDRPNLDVIIAAADGLGSTLAGQVASWTDPVRLIEGRRDRLAAMRAAHAALACSGTAVVQLAAAATPVVAAYRLGSATYLAAKLLIRTPFITLVNVAAGRFVVPERVQGACTPGRLAADLAPLLDDPAVRSARIAEQSAALSILRGGIADPSAAAADALVELLKAGLAAPGG